MADRFDRCGDCGGRRGDHAPSCPAAWPPSHPMNPHPRGSEEWKLWEAGFEVDDDG